MNALGPNQGQAVGDVVDLLVNVDAGQVLYALVGSGGFLGIGQTVKPVPWDAVRYSAADNTLVLPVTADQLNSAPDLTLDKSPEHRRCELGRNRPAVLDDAHQPVGNVREPQAEAARRMR